jgi:hypothetical protein
VRLTPGDTALALTLDGKDVDARACGPAVAGAAGTRMVLRAEAHVRGNARLQLRGLTYAGRVLRTQLGEAVQELELPGESDSAEALVDLPAGVAQVRPCVVFEGASGSVTLRDLAFLLPLSLELPRDTP